MPDSPSTARELLVRFPNSRRDVSGCSRVRESPCRLAGLVFRTKRTTAIEPANNGPRFKLTTPVQQTQTTQKRFTSNSSALATAGGLCPPGPPRFSASAPIPESKQKRDAPRMILRRPASGLGTWHGARVASPRGPILRPGYRPFYLRPQRRTTTAARPVRGASANSSNCHPALPAGCRAEISLKSDVSWVGPTAPRALYAILGGRFLDSHPFSDQHTRNANLRRNRH